MSKITVHIGQEHHEVDASDITVLVPSAQVVQEINVEGYLKLDQAMATYHISKVQKIHPELYDYVYFIFGSVLNIARDEFTADNIRLSGSGVQHSAGRFDIALKLQDQGVNAILHSFPEGSLHPSVHGNLVEALMKLQNRGRLRQQKKLAAILEQIDDPAPAPDKAAKPLFPEGNSDANV